MHATDAQSHSVIGWFRGAACGGDNGVATVSCGCQPKSLGRQPRAVRRFPSLHLPATSAHRRRPTSAGSQAAPDFGRLRRKGYSVASGFGYRWGRLHAGVDLAAPHGTPIYAAASGTVIMARWYGGYGNCVIIQHPDGVVSLYGHQSKI